MTNGRPRRTGGFWTVLGDIVRLVLGEGLKLAVAGVAAGVVIARR